jgi:DNA polymerase III subunit alpha
MSWISLHNYSQYSILNATSSIDALVERARRFAMPALALTDQGNLYGAVEFFKACKAAGIKPLLGCELHLAPGSRLEKKKIPGVPHGYPLILIAKDKEGFKNLCKLTSIAHLEGFYYTPRIDKEILQQYSKGLICLSGTLYSSIGRLCVQQDEKALIEEIDWFSSLFGDDFYFELERHEMSDERIRAEGIESESFLHQNYLDYIKNLKTIETHLLRLSREKGIACVAANRSHYIDREDWKAQEILMNIQSGEPCEIWEKDSFGNPKVRVLNPKRQTFPTHEYYFKSPDEISDLFADLPEAIANTGKIAEKCTLELDLKNKFYPVFVPPDLIDTEISKEEREKEAEKFLVKLCYDGIAERYSEEKLAKVKEKYPDREPLEVVKERLAYELDIILSKGMCDYLLIVWDFISWAKGQGIPVGPGRGSGAGSIILYLIGVTNIEPLRFNLFFERFINPERLSYPDIDVDICMDRRGEVIAYTVKKYGQDKVAQIITFGTMKAKMAVKDVGRVLSVPLAKVNQIAKLIPEDINMTLEKALEIDPDLRMQYQEDEEVHNLIDIAKKLEGSVRNTGIHAAGLIISGDPLTDHIPLCRAKDSDIAVTQFSMKPVEAVGMLKIDFLGLKTLTSIQKAVQAIEQSQGIKIDWANLPLENSATFSLMNQGKTLGIFQLESPGMQDLARQLNIDKFEEIIAVGALYRPGPMEMIPSFINRKHRREVIEIDHPLMGDVLAETYGIMVYQEQVMQIASLLASYSLGEGDVLRRAMGKKDKEEMKRQREKFLNGAHQNSIDENKAGQIFDKIEKFASYGFNKSHAAAYGYLTYATAYLKANYPQEWMAALMTCDRDDLSKVAKVIRECRTMEIAILPPDINEARTEFVATPKGIRFALTAIKGVGEGVALEVIAEREKRGPFTSLYDFFKRVDQRKVGKKIVENLIEAGCFDFTGWSRSALLESIDPIYREATREQKEQAKGVIDFFSLIEEESENPLLTPPDIKNPLTKHQILKREKELLGFYLTGHPMDEYEQLLPKLSCVPLSKLRELPDIDSVVRIACILETVQVKIASRSQRKFAILTISDGMEQFEVPLWSDLYEEKSDLLEENRLVYAIAAIDRREDPFKLQIKWFDDLSRVDEEMIRISDDQYQRIKMQLKLSESREKKTLPAKLVQEMKTRLKVTVDADELRHSEIINLKKLFRSYPGSTSISMRFSSRGRAVGSIEIESTWGISYNEEVERALKNFSSIREINVEKQ